MTRKMSRKTTSPSTSQLVPTPELTLMDHLRELRGRLFWVATSFLVISATAYPFFNQIVSVLVRPLDGQKLYYLTVAGGISFIIKICLYVGIIGMLPLLVYHIYQFLRPVMKHHSSKIAALYILASITLGVAGIAFAYFMSLPAALKFLTDVGIEQVSSLLTIDSYISFIVSYLIAGALLFQLPLIMLIINNITTLPPKLLLGFQRYVVVISFTLAALISPTPDVVNQTILAIPMVLMYQIGIVAIWIVQRQRRGETASAAVRVASIFAPSSLVEKSDAPTTSPFIKATKRQQPHATRKSLPRRSIDGISRTTAVHHTQSQATQSAIDS